MKKKPLKIPDDDNPFLTIGKLLDEEISVAVLASAIEAHDICTYDEYGRFVFANDELKASALELLADHHEWESTAPEERSDEDPRSPMDRWGSCGENQYYHFGWTKNEAPDFLEIQRSNNLSAEEDETKLPKSTKPPGHLNHDLDLQQKANAMAESMKISSGRNADKNAANDINSEDSRTLEVKSNTKVSDQGTSANQCAPFLSMKNLTADEVSFAFVGDKAKSGIVTNNLLEISARGKTKKVALAAINLIDRHRRSLNSQCAVLLGMAQKRVLVSSDVNKKRISRLRSIFRIHLGITDPFDPYRKGIGWEPRFKICDRRGASDTRAELEAERKTVSYEQSKESGEKTTDRSQMSDRFDSEEDAADIWLKANDIDKFA